MRRQLVAVAMILLGLMATGCAGLSHFEVTNRDMGTTYTNAVNNAAVKLAEKCEGGVEYDYRFYRHESKPKVETPGYRHLYQGNDTYTTSRSHVQCETLPTDLPDEKKRQRRPL
jgi:hypothetical protein